MRKIIADFLKTPLGTLLISILGFLGLCIMLQGSLYFARDVKIFRSLSDVQQTFQLRFRKPNQDSKGGDNNSSASINIEQQKGESSTSKSK